MKRKGNSKYRSRRDNITMACALCVVNDKGIMKRILLFTMGKMPDSLEKYRQVLEDIYNLEIRQVIEYTEFTVSYYVEVRDVLRSLGFPDCNVRECASIPQWVKALKGENDFSRFETYISGDGN